MCKAIALQIQDKEVEEIRKNFGVEDPKWTPEELAKIEEENAWAYDTKKWSVDLFLKISPNRLF